MISAAAREVVSLVESKKKVTTILTLGHNRFKVIDRIMVQELGTNVRDYWNEQSVVYKSMLRRRIWEQALMQLKAKDVSVPEPTMKLEDMIDSAKRRS
jgi:hypothetical protein